MCSFGLTICKSNDSHSETISLWWTTQGHGRSFERVLCLRDVNGERANLTSKLPAAWFSSHLWERTRKRYLYTPGRAQFAVRSSWRPGLAPAGREILLWRGSLSSSPWQTHWSGKPLRWCLLDSRTDHLEEEKQKQCCGRTQWEIPLRNWSKKKFF